MKKLLALLFALAMVLCVSVALASPESDVQNASEFAISHFQQVRENGAISPSATNAAEKYYIMKTNVYVKMPVGMKNAGTKTISGTKYDVWNGTGCEGNVSTMYFNKMSSYATLSRWKTALSNSGYTNTGNWTKNGIQLVWGRKYDYYDDTYTVFFIFNWKSKSYGIQSVDMTRTELTNNANIIEQTINKSSTSGIVVNASSLTLYPTQTFKLVPSLQSKTSAKFTFKSDKTSVAKVSSSGVVTAKKKGTANITIKTGSKSLKVKVTVKASPAISFTSTQYPDLEIGDTNQIRCSFSLASAATIRLYDWTYSSDDEDVAEVSDTGLITAVGEGEAIITVKTSGGSVGKVYVSVTDPWAWDDDDDDDWDDDDDDDWDWDDEDPTPAPTATPVPTMAPVPTATPVTGSTTYRAYVVGQLNYTDSYGRLDPLYGCDTDANAVSALLGHLADNYIVTHKQDRSASQILNDAATAFAGADADDVSLFYYSGHGTSSGSLCGVDGSNITTSQLFSTLNAVPGKVILILDSCFSGQAINSGSSFNSSVISTFSKGGQIPDFWSGNGSVMASAGEFRTSKFLVLTASSKTETSTTYGGASGWRGMFTEKFLEGAGWNESNNVACAAYADTNYNKVLTLNEAYTYAYTKVNATMAQYGWGTQTVQVYPVGSSATLFNLN